MDIKVKIDEAVKDFSNLTAEDCYEIVLAAKSLSVEECLDSLLLAEDELSTHEMAFVHKLHKYGRAIGIKDAADNLFMHMKTKNGGQTALDYLEQMSGEFSVTVTPGSNSGFSFNVQIGEKK